MRILGIFAGQSDMGLIAEMLFDRGRILEQLNRSDEASKSYLTAVKLNPALQSRLQQTESK